MNTTETICSNIDYVAVFIAAVATYLACHPILAFVGRGWAIKRTDILSSFDNEAKTLYLATFLKVQPKDPASEFDTMYTRRYGRYRLIVPVILLMLVLIPIVFLIAETGLAYLPFGQLKAPTYCAAKIPILPLEAVAAATGAYIWVVYGLISNAARYNLPPPFVQASALRMTAAIPIGYAIGSLGSAGLAPFLAFAAGAFPLETVQTILQRVATNKLGLNIGTDPNGKVDDQVTKLDGVDPPTGDRLEDADISTVPQLAYCDPVQLSMRTNIRFDAIVDLVDQALAWIYLGNALEKVRPYGLRGAMEIANLRNDLLSGDPAMREPAERTLKACGAVTGLDCDGLQHAFGEIAEDPYTEFLAHVWPASE